VRTLPDFFVRHDDDRGVFANRFTDNACSLPEDSMMAIAEQWTGKRIMIAKGTVIGLAVAVAIGSVGGCATPKYQSQQVGETAIARAGEEIRRADNWAPRYLSDEDAEKKVIEIYGRLLPGATALCREMGEHACAWDIQYSPDPDVNAFAVGQNVVLIKKGIMRHAENDDEVAMVIAHEMSHHAADHISESRMNAATGAIIGGLVLGAIAGAAYGGSDYSPVYTQYQVNDAVNTGMQAGAELGQLSFSKGQENEADYLAAHILHRSGYDLDKARRMWVKLGKLGTTEHGERYSFNTHTDPSERLARWDATIVEVMSKSLGNASPLTRDLRLQATAKPAVMATNDGDAASMKLNPEPITTATPKIRVSTTPSLASGTSRLGSLPTVAPVREVGSAVGVQPYRPKPEPKYRNFEKTSQVRWRN
jgi:predicted Zn-dependent protease